MDSTRMNTKPADDSSKNSQQDEFKFYLTNGMKTEQVAALLKTQGKSKSEVDAFMEKYVEARNKLSKFIKKFTQKLLATNLSEPGEIASAGIKYASKHGFSQTEKEAFIRYVLKGDIEGPYMYNQDLGYTDMSKFLGLSSYVGSQIDIKATDQSSLNEIARLFEHSRSLHAAVKNNLVMYRDCAPEALLGKYDSNYHNVQLHIHPVIVAMFLNKIDDFEKRMLYSNIGRMIVQRSQFYMRKYMNTNDNYLPGELDADTDLSVAISRDPNSLSYFTDETPIVNLLKRFKIQIELWKNVMSLRQGRYYSKNDFDSNDNITGFIRIINSFDWTYFDSPDTYQVQDECTILKKLIGVFSFRPIFSQISSFIKPIGMGYSNIGQINRSLHNFVSQPLINVRLIPQQSVSVNLKSVMNQADWFIEHKSIVPKNRSVIYCSGPLIFVINRRYQSINFANANMGIQYMNVQQNFTGLTTINDVDVVVDNTIKIKNDTFELRSAVVVNKPILKDYVSTSCAAIVISPANIAAGKTSTDYYIYNPSISGYADVDPTTGKKVNIDPINNITPRSNGQNPGAIDLIKKYGTILIYIKQ